MKGFIHAALAGALAVTAPAPAARAQGQETLFARALEFARGSRLGVTVHDIDDDAAAAKDAKTARVGVIVDTVDPGGPADKAGIKAGDAITEFDGERVRSVRQFSRLVQETPGGRAVQVALSRGGQRSTVTVTAERSSYSDDFSMRLLEAARPMRAPRALRPPEPPTPPRAVMPAIPLAPFSTYTGRRLGMSVETLDEQLAQYFGVKEGVLVRSVTADSAAAKAGLKAGDVITAINGRQI